jgi:hypothetical protein
MASIRRGYSDDFVIKNNKVGIGTSNPQETLDVVGGALQGQDLKVAGVSTQTGYTGFLRSKHEIEENTTLTFDQGPVSSLSGEIIVGTGVTVTVSKVEDEFANANNGTVWSNFLTVSTGGFTSNYEASKAFDGDVTTYCMSSVNEAVFTFTPPTPIQYKNRVRIWLRTSGHKARLNGGTYIFNIGAPTVGQWMTIATGSGLINTIDVQYTQGSLSAINAIEVDGEILVDGFSTLVDKGARAGSGQLNSLKVFNTFTPPSGGTNERPAGAKPGQLFYNYDLKTIEFYDGSGWRQVDNTTRSGRAVFAGGYTPTSGAAGSFASVMDYVNISTKGNAVNFGEMHAGTYAALFGFSSATRGVFGGGYKNATSTASNNDVAYITIASEGNTIDFGNLNSSKNWGKSAHASSTRGLAIGGYTVVNDIDYVEIATLGNFLDFGDLFAAEFGGAGMGSPTVALSVASGPNGYINQVTIASKGNAILWGEADKNPEYYAGGGSNSVKGLFNKNRLTTTQVQSLIIASSGTIEDFGNLTSTTSSNGYPGGNGNCASQTTLLFAGGSTAANAINTIETITITTAGDATDFGDLTTKRGYMGAFSDSHGGLGGF